MKTKSIIHSIRIKIYFDDVIVSDKRSIYQLNLYADPTLFMPMVSESISKLAHILEKSIEKMNDEKGFSKFKNQFVDLKMRIDLDEMEIFRQSFSKKLMIVEVPRALTVFDIAFGKSWEQMFPNLSGGVKP